MKNILLTTTFLFLLSSFAFSQFQMDVSSGFNRLSSGFSNYSKNGFYVAVSPSIALKHRFRLRTTVQFKQSLSSLDINLRSIDISPELEYEWFDFLSFGTGIYFSRNLNTLLSGAFNPTPEVGPVVFFKFFKLRNAYATIRYSQSVLGELIDSSNMRPFFQQNPSPRSFYQLGLGYTFGKKNTAKETIGYFNK